MHFSRPPKTRLALVSTNLELHAVPKPEIRAAKALVPGSPKSSFKAWKTHVGAASALLVFLPYPE